MNKKFLLLSCFLVLLLSGKAQIIFGSAEVNDLYEKLPVNSKNAILQTVGISKNIRINDQIPYNDRILDFSIDDEMLTHIGLRLDGLPLVNSYDSIIKNFIERTFFRLIFDNSISNMVKTAEAKQIRFYYQGNDILYSGFSAFDELIQFINKASEFKIKKDDHLFMADWSNSQEHLSMTFPNNYQLLIGKNKNELDDELCIQMGRMIEINSTPIELRVQPIINDSVAVSVINGSQFMGKLSSDTFFRKNGNDTIWFFEKGSIPYSISNLFHRKELSENHTLHITHNLYGERSIAYKINLHSFIDFFSSDFQTFVGLESSKQDLIEGTIVLRHKYFNFIHMLHFKTSINEVFNNNGNIEANFYGNIPNHNIDNLFKEFSSNPANNKIDINIKNP